MKSYEVEALHFDERWCFKENNWKHKLVKQVFYVQANSPREAEFKVWDKLEKPHKITSVKEIGGN